MSLVHAAFEFVAVWIPVCWMKALLGLPCPACGSTRALRHLLHGDVAGAAAMNPGLVAGLALAPLLAVWIARTPSGPWPPARLRLYRVAAVSAVAANWLYVLSAGV